MTNNLFRLQKISIRNQAWGKNNDNDNNSNNWWIEILLSGNYLFWCNRKQVEVSKENFICIRTDTWAWASQLNRSPATPIKHWCSKTEMRFFTVKRLCTTRLEPLCLDNAFHVRAAEVRKPTVKRYNHSQQDANFRCAVRKGWRNPFHVGLNLPALTCAQKGCGSGFLFSPLSFSSASLNTQMCKWTNLKKGNEFRKFHHFHWNELRVFLSDFDSCRACQ